MSLRDEIPDAVRPQEVRAHKNLCLEDALGVIEHENKKELLLKADEVHKKQEFYDSFITKK